MQQKEQILQAVKVGDLEQVKQLLEKDTSLLSTRNSEGMSLLLIALFEGHRDVAFYLEVLSPELDLFEASALGQDERILELLEEDPQKVKVFTPNGWTPLHLAARFGRLEAAEQLVTEGADLHCHSKNSLEYTPLHSATIAGKFELVRFLVSEGSDVDCRAAGWTPLHLAACQPNPALIRFLLDWGADPHMTTNEGLTPLAIARRNGYSEIVKLLE